MQTKAAWKFYIRERDNYQSVYFVAEGRLSKAAALRLEKPLHGCNTMHVFNTQEEYEAGIARITKDGGRFL